jgi:WD40 repeat protein
MAEAADREARALKSSRGAVVVRFLGTSPASSGLADLLGSLCRQLHSISGAATVLPSNDDVEKLKQSFEHALKTWQTGRLTLFLDSLDQLDSTAGGRLLSWLPTHALSPHVRLVVSTLSDETAPSDGKPFACLSILQNRYANLFSEYAVEVQPVSDVRFLLLHHLQIHKRKLSDTQLRVLEAAVNVSPKMQTPLVIGILAVRFSDWPSHRDFPHDNKNLDGTLFIDTTSVRALIKQEFKALEAKHGSELVRAALSFITLAKDGVSETELSEILSLDDDVLASVYEWWVPPVRTLPTNPLTMLLVDLKPYLAKRGAINGCGGLMMQWYHRQFWEAAHEYCFCDAREFRYRHAQLGEFFSGTWADRSKPYNCNLKAAVQKKMVGEVSGDRRVRPQPLCLREGKNIFMTRGDAGAVNARRSRAAVHHFLAAGKLSEAADELCSFEGICGRVLCGEGSVLMQQLIHLGECIRSCIRLRNFQAAHQLRRVEHFTNWLRRDISVIISDPYTEIFASCSRQPEVSLARMELQAYMQLTSAGISASCDDAWHARSFVLGPVLRNFDRCISQMRFHKLGVNCVAFNFDSSLLASASEDGWVALWNPATSLVEGVLKGVAVQRCHSIAAKPGAFDDLMKMMKMGIKSVSWNPDGSLLATGHLDDTVRIWNVSTQQEVAVLRGHKSWIDSVSFCEEGKYVASGSFDCTVRLWDLRTRREMAILTGHTAGIRSVQWKGSFVASGSLDTTVRIWNSSTRKVAAVLKGHSRGVCCLAFDASGKLVASGSEDCTIRLWDVVRMQTVAVLKGHTAYVLSVAFAPNGKLIASGSDDRTVRLWDSSTFKGIAMHTATDIGWAHSVTFDKSSTILASGHEDGTIRLCSVSMQEEEVQELRDEVVCVAFDRSGRYLAAGFYNSIQVWEAFTQQKIAVIRSPASAAGWGSHTIHGRNVGWGICHVAFDGSGKRIASGSVDKTIRLWDIRTQRQVALFRGHSARIASVAFDGSNKHIASGSDDKTVRLWSVGEGREVAVFTAHTEKVTSVAFDGSGKYVASGSADMTVRLWSVRLLCEVAVLRGHTDTVWSVACDMSGMYIASGSRDWTVRLWDVSAQKAIAVLRGPTHKDGDGFDGVMSVAFDGSGKYIASGSDDKSIRLWDVRTRQEVALFKGHTGNITSVAFDWSGRFIASSAVNAVFFPDDNTVRLWDTGMRQVISKQFGGPVENRLVELDWSGHYVASLSPDDFTIRLWDVSKQQQVLLLKGHAKAVLAMAFDGSNKHIASGSDDKTVRLWSVGEGREVAVFTAHTEKVTSVAFDGSGKYVASGSADMTVRLWDVSNHSAVACLKGLSSHITSICFSPTSALIAAGSDDGCVCVWNAPSGATVVNYTANTRVALLCLTWSTDEVLLAVGSCDGSITLSKVSSGVQCAVLQCPEAAAISGIALSYDACLLAAAVTATSCVHVFDVASALPLGTCELRGSARQLLWGADGVLRDGQGQLWKLQ